MKYRQSKDIAVIGLGRFGSAVVDELIKLGKQITLIDDSPEKLKLYEDDAQRLIVGDAAETKLLRSIGIEKIETVIVAVPDNIEIIASLLEMNVKNIIARATSRRHARVLRQIGVSVIIRPEQEAGTRAALIASNQKFILYSNDLQELGNGFVLGTSEIKNPKIFNMTIKDLNLNSYGITIVLIKTNNTKIRPTGDTVLNPNDQVTVIGEIDNVTAAFEWFNNADE
ncbi:trk system potassium uptake protein TrkA [Mycoplasmopsis mustelae]|uniref:Trk system potassium uptake protein TrkA n=1 Tax=Mycoplasmopsis mustelae TaxID=171289 RepID=A0A4R7UCI6_9BACT|nr:TrkA family potassium uptake protein [Mycoplasmopsis mustelae]TDV24117.1 trk system potassium uptake protein TrkA [Mycoplasmopsis mustelae]